MRSFSCGGEREQALVPHRNIHANDRPTIGVEVEGDAAHHGIKARRSRARWPTNTGVPSSDRRRRCSTAAYLWSVADSFGDRCLQGGEHRRRPQQPTDGKRRGDAPDTTAAGVIIGRSTPLYYVLGDWHHRLGERRRQEQTQVLCPARATLPSWSAFRRGTRIRSPGSWLRSARQRDRARTAQHLHGHGAIGPKPSIPSPGGPVVLTRETCGNETPAQSAGFRSYSADDEIASNQPRSRLGR